MLRCIFMEEFNCEKNSANLNKSENKWLVILKLFFTNHIIKITILVYLSIKKKFFFILQI